MYNIEEQKILEIVSGSNLYGTATENSDKDYVGVLIGNEDIYIGLEQLEEVDTSIKSKNEDGKNNKDAIDRKFYEIRNFCKLALQNNPNIIEILFVNPENIIFQNHFGSLLLNNRHLFPWKGAKQRFLGYAFAQKHKMIIRTDHFYVLNEAYEYFSELISKDPFSNGNKLLAEYRDKNIPFISFTKGTGCSIGDLNFDISRKIKDVTSMLRNRLDKVTNRSELMMKHGYDTKFASHLVRLITEGIELLETGSLSFPLKSRHFILDIKQGKYKMKEVLDYSDQLEQQLVDIEKKSILPSKPKYKEVNELLKRIVRETVFDPYHICDDCKDIDGG